MCNEVVQFKQGTTDLISKCTCCKKKERERKRERGKEREKERERQSDPDRQTVKRREHAVR